MRRCRHLSKEGIGWEKASHSHVIKHDSAHVPLRQMVYMIRPTLGRYSVQDSDGGFFEDFTALSWKQENRRLQASREVSRDVVHCVI
ncbi:hypothetical protein HPB51_017315 [Rhipicephalus microplus]|uniref:Uncharacterized protein n=1 Tax=Rhipicephalus microplus TaxID=6941 RepID=A0A9J6EUC3_RHIMP|nr:hypothetical protein HPB51_017315 [Rhipicephalus microplus]